MVSQGSVMASLESFRTYVHSSPSSWPEPKCSVRRFRCRVLYHRQRSQEISWKLISRRARTCRAALEEGVEPSIPKEDTAKELSQLKSGERNSKSGTRRRADSTDGISSALSRRFGLAGGLAWFGFLAFGVISEQIKTRVEVYNEEQGSRMLDSAEVVSLPGGTKYKDLRVGGGSSPTRRDLVVLSIVGKVQGQETSFIDTQATKRDLVLTFGGRPLIGGICEGLESALSTMRTGGTRQVFVPPSQGFGEKGLDLGNGNIVQPNASLEYVIELKRVSIPPS